MAAVAGARPQRPGGPRVDELIDEPQSLVSYHLRLLREGGLVTARRSSADGRDSYYAIDLAPAARRCSTPAPRCIPRCVLARAGLSACPERRRRPRVLFLCTGNSARSQIAEALLDRMSAGTIEAVSAGSHPKPLHPNAIRVLRTYGIDISGHRTKHLDEFRHQRFDTVITLCDRVREVCPSSRRDRTASTGAFPTLRSGSRPPCLVPRVRAHRSELEARINFRLYLLTNILTEETH